ncbi:hypothetical protein DK150_620005 [Flavobacterium psychrophilum]|nr:hypothetical protein DK150_620005 [Flavobacterium psychrophilum]
MELSLRIKFSLSRKLRGYELPAISKWQDVMAQRRIDSGYFNREYLSSHF